MAVRLRLRRMGSKKRPFYRIVAADSRYQRDGRFLEICGYYDPMAKPMTLEIDKDKVFGWLGKGAQMSTTVESLLRKEGVIQEYRTGITSEAPEAPAPPAEPKMTDAGEAADA